VPSIREAALHMTSELASCAAPCGSPSRLGKRTRSLIVVVCVSLCGCSVQRLAIDSVGDFLAAGPSVYETENDRELVAEALPFGLKLVESLLAEQPEHRRLLLTAARGYLLYAYAFVSIPAQQARLDDLDRALELRQRARNLFLRAHGYASRALALDYPALQAALDENPETAVRALSEAAAVPALYSTAASLGLAISASRNEPALLARLPEVEAMLERALELDEAWNDGALHEFAIHLAAGGSTTADRAVLEEHYERALELSAGTSAGLFVTYAEAAAVPAQDRARFIELLGRALAVDVDAAPQRRLLNVIAQARARWLIDNVDELFLE
jgi:predicted anti-sigma-YlaC factor YlaD